MSESLRKAEEITVLWRLRGGKTTKCDVGPCWILDQEKDVAEDVTGTAGKDYSLEINNIMSNVNFPDFSQLYCGHTRECSILRDKGSGCLQMTQMVLRKCISGERTA